MKCFQFRDLLDEYMDRQVDALQSKAMEEHAAACPECRHRLIEREQLFQRLEMSREPVWTVDLSDSIMARIRAVPTPTYSNPLVRPIMIAIVTALIVSGLLILIGYSSLPKDVSPVDILRLLAGSVEMPSGLRASLDEVCAFASGCWVAFRVLIQILSRIGSVILFRVPGTIPFILVCSLLVLAVWRVWRQRRGSTFTHLGL